MNKFVFNKNFSFCKALTVLGAMFFGCKCILGQEIKVQITKVKPIKFEKLNKYQTDKKESPKDLYKREIDVFEKELSIKPLEAKGFKVFGKEEDFQNLSQANPPKRFFIDKELPKPQTFKTPKEFASPKQYKQKEKFHWKPAIVESLYFLAIQQSFRMIQKKTKRELDGKFFLDWGKSVRNLGGWRDGDSFLTNYIAHPMQGAVTGRIFINNSDKSKKLEFGKSKDYWKSRLKAMAWSAVWSAQFELGPISEASIGNVGLYDDVGPNRMGWVDMVVTPTAGTGVLIGEDLIDKYVLKKWLERKSSRTRIKIFRTFFTPFQSFTNVLRGKVPWKRDNR